MSSQRVTAPVDHSDDPILELTVDALARMASEIHRAMPHYTMRECANVALLEMTDALKGDHGRLARLAAVKASA